MARVQKRHSRLNSPRMQTEAEQTWHGMAWQYMALSLHITLHHITLHTFLHLYTTRLTPEVPAQAVVAQRSCLQLTFDDAGHGQADTTETVPHFLLSDFAMRCRCHSVSCSDVYCGVELSRQVHVHTQLVECASLGQN